MILSYRVVFLWSVANVYCQFFFRDVRSDSYVLLLSPNKTKEVCRVSGEERKPCGGKVTPD